MILNQDGVVGNAREKRQNNHERLSKVYSKGKANSILLDLCKSLITR